MQSGRLWPLFGLSVNYLWFKKNFIQISVEFCFFREQSFRVFCFLWPGDLSSVRCEIAGRVSVSEAEV